MCIHAAGFNVVGTFEFYPAKMPRHGLAFMNYLAINIFIDKQSLLLISDQSLLVILMVVFRIAFA